MMARLRSCLLPLSFGVVSLVFFGCSNDQPSSGKDAAARSRQQAADDLREQEENTPPSVGMTKETAFRRYGNPKSDIVTDQGERVVWFLNEGEVVGKSLIPFYIPPRPRFAVLMFGPNGRVKEFHFDAREQR